MLTSVWSLVSWGRRAAATILAVGAGRWYQLVRGHADQVDQPRSAEARPAAGTPAPTGIASGAPSPDQVPPQQRLTPSRPTPAPVRAAVVRAWARAHGLPVADRGPVPSWVMDQYLAQGGRPTVEWRETASTAPTRRPS